MKPVSTAAAIIPDSLAGRDDGMNDIRTVEPNWLLLGDVVGKVIGNATREYLKRKKP